MALGPWPRRSPERPSKGKNHVHMCFTRHKCQIHVTRDSRVIDVRYLRGKYTE